MYVTATLFTFAITRITAMERNEELKKALIDALGNNQYEVEIEEPNNVSVREKYDGSEYLYLRGDDVKFGVSFGSCTVTILEHSFTCDLNFGEWSAGQDDDEWLLEEDDFINALEDADGVISGVMGEPDDQAFVYCRANNIDEDLPAYWCEDDDLPKDIDNLSWYDPVPGVVSVVLNGGETMAVECDLQCESIYRLYCRLEEKGLLFASPEVSSAFIKEEVPELYHEILDELEFNDVLDGKTEDVLFTLSNTEDFFESILG